MRDLDFAGLYGRLIGLPLTKNFPGPISKNSTTPQIAKMLDAGRDFLRRVSIPPKRARPEVGP